jgi:hypothetical protein
VANKRYGLVLTLEGAPGTPHTIPGLPGYFRADVPTPVGGENELSLDAAKAFIKKHDESVRRARKDWQQFEREQEKRGNRPNGRQRFEAQPCPVALVEIPQGDVAAAEKVAATDVAEARRSQREVARQDLNPRVEEKVREETESLKGAK